MENGILALIQTVFVFRKNLLKLHVFYEELDVEVISEHRSYEVGVGECSL